MKYLFYISKTYSIPVIAPLVKYLKQEDSEYRFYISAKVNKQFPDVWDRKLILHNIGETKEFKPDFVLCPGNFVDFRIPGKKVQLFHGLGVEKDVHYKIRHFFDIYLTSGPYVTKKYNILKEKYKSFLVYETGWPKIDYILNYLQENLKEALGIPFNKKIILYAPTFSTSHESATALVDTIPAILNSEEFWIFKFHELMDKETINKFKTIENSKGKVLEKVEITPYLHVADIMISDTSSVIYEFMVLDKPVITYKTQKRQKGIDILKAEQLRAAIDRSFQNPQEFKELRGKNILDVNPYLDKKISARVFKKLEEIYLKQITPQKRKPLNLFRKAQIIYHSLFKKGYIR